MRPADGDLVVQEWDDAARLEKAVEKLAAERSEIATLNLWKRVIGASAFAAVAASLAIAGLASAAGPGPFVVGLFLVNSIVVMRACLIDEIEQEIARRRLRASQWADDARERLESTDWLLVP